MSDVQFEKDVQQFKSRFAQILAKMRKIATLPFTRRHMPTWCRSWGCVCILYAVFLAWTHRHAWEILSVAVDAGVGCWMFWLASLFTKEVHFVVPMPETLGGVDIEITSQGLNMPPHIGSKKVN